MADAKVTQRFAVTFVDELARAGLRHVCLAPGSRSAPLAMAFARHRQIRVWVHIDERCAAFFGLGIAKATDQPVGVLCTSGTAAAEFHAAVIEAHHSRTPLLVLTADRPPELREVGANQAIDQAHLYGGAVRWYFDPGVPDDEAGAAARWRRLAGRALAEALGPPAGPVHLNLPFREPLTVEPGAEPDPEPASGPPIRVERRHAEPSSELVERLAETLRAARRPLVVAGEMRDGARLRRPLDLLLARLDAPLLAEPTSQLRRASAHGLAEAYDPLLREPGWAPDHAADVVIRLGAPVTSKPLSQYIDRHCESVIALDPDAGWRDPEQRAAEMLAVDPAPLLEAVAGRLGGRPSTAWQDSWRSASEAATAAIERRLAGSTMHEGHVVRALASVVPEEASVFVGSSMAIRDVDSFWPAAGPGLRFIANRGASGIDGLVSTGLGVAAASREPAVLLIGDLSLYHDMNGLLAARRHGVRAVLVVLDNNGGGIFDFLPQSAHKDVFEEVFGTPLNLRLEDVARLYDVDFCETRDPRLLPQLLQRALAADHTSLVCARFERQASVEGHRACWEAAAEAIRRR
jgi:2-succinyl-5-enolpyruvyl-6-hydroxy-3-cyclohexene-1-carboxylate synthase